jgi:hypothetical protein
VGGGRVALSIPDPSTPATCPGVRTRHRNTPRWCRASGGRGPRPGVTQPRRAAGEGSPRTQRAAPSPPHPGVRPRPVTERPVMVRARSRGSRHPATTGRGNPGITAGRPPRGTQSPAIAGGASQASRHLAGRASRVRRRAVTARPPRRPTAPAATAAPPRQARCPATPGPPRRARQPLAGDGERARARAGVAIRQPPRADRTIPGGIQVAEAIRVVDANRATGGTIRDTGAAQGADGKRLTAGETMRAGRPGAGPRTAGQIMCSQRPAPGEAAAPPHLVRSQAAHVTFTPTAATGLAPVVTGLRPARSPIVAGGGAVTLPGAKPSAGRRPAGRRPAGRRPAGRWKAAWPGELALGRGASSPAAATSWTGTTMPSWTATPQVVAGGADCSAGAAARPIQNLITMTPGAATQGAGRPARPPRPGPSG